MNDTQVNARQRKLLGYLFANPSSSRAELETSLEDEKGSRITVIRDLNHLLALGWVEQIGGGKHVKYSLKAGRELLIPLDSDEYFSKISDL